MRVSSSFWLFAPGVAFGLIALVLATVPFGLQPAEDGRPDPKAAKRLLRVIAILAGLLSVACLLLAAVLAAASTAD
jgi:Na+/proline symporter